MLSVEFQPSPDRRKWILFGTTNNKDYAQELLKACRMHHPGCQCRCRGRETLSGPAGLSGTAKRQGHFPAASSRAS